MSMDMWHKQVYGHVHMQVHRHVHRHVADVRIDTCMLGLLLGIGLWYRAMTYTVMADTVMADTVIAYDL